MKRFVSLATKPGRTGTYYYNKMFEAHGLDATYEALECLDLSKAVSNLRGVSLGGISVTMPFKREILKFLDEADESVSATGACNTVVVNGSHWTGFNTDLIGVEWATSQIKTETSIQVLGDGAMGSMFAMELSKTGKEFEVFSRSLGNWHERHGTHSTIINTTALGTLDSSSPLNEILGANLIIDLALVPGDLHSLAKASATRYVSGLEFYKWVFLAQYEKYTGMQPSPDLFDKLSGLRAAQAT